MGIQGTPASLYSGIYPPPNSGLAANKNKQVANLNSLAAKENKAQFSLVSPAPRSAVFAPADFAATGADSFVMVPAESSTFAAASGSAAPVYIIPAGHGFNASQPQRKEPTNHQKAMEKYSQRPWYMRALIGGTALAGAGLISILGMGMIRNTPFVQNLVTHDNTVIRWGTNGALFLADCITQMAIWDTLMNIFNQ